MFQAPASNERGSWPAVALSGVRAVATHIDDSSQHARSVAQVRPFDDDIARTFRPNCSERAAVDRKEGIRTDRDWAADHTKVCERRHDPRGKTRPDTIV
jgi:hypothetical protein